ncbi:MAG: aminotransferase class I/II-fold pyridoxal phosphate-dependent enzyme, partial [Christensenellaceae bacterium]|nr:aminotransferase class I/II-fold pyridoxal phosphate-dependent enzyme [Christensenellaceae bacterium]
MLYPFNIPPFLGEELNYIKDAIERRKICGDGFYTKQCNNFLADYCKSAGVLLATSGTHALEMAAILLNIKEGDEVIMPSFTFVSTANAFALRGAKCVFIDVRPDTMNMDETLIEQAVTPATKAIVPVHYAGLACEMDTICSIAKKYNLAVVEDAAQGVTSTYKGRQLGSIGDIGCFSFHETKNFSMGEGGAVLLKTHELFERAEIIREKGTNRS